MEMPEKKGCAPDPIVVEKPVTIIDSTEEDLKIEAEKKAAEAETAKEIEVLEEKHAEDIEHFNEGQREQYEEVKEKGPDAVADWLTSFNRSL